MPTSLVNLDVNQYVKVTPDTLIMSSLLLQSHRDTVRITFSINQPVKSNTVFHELSGKHSILNVKLTETPLWALAMTDRSKLTITEQREPIEISDRGDIGNAVYIQDQTTPLFDIKFLNRLGNFQLAITTTPDTRFFTASPGHGINANEVISMKNIDGFIQALVLDVVGDVIEIDSLIGDVYEIGNDYNRSTSDMRVDGSTTPILFSLKPDPGQSGDINAIKWAVQDGSSMDFSTFGSANALTNGVLLRYKRSNGSYENLFSWKANGGLILKGFTHYFQDKTGGGLFSFICKVVFNSQENNGVTIRVDGDLGEELQIVIQDNLTSINQSLIEASGQGSGIQK